MNSVHRMAFPLLALVATGCATTYESACHELTETNRSEIKQRCESVKKGTFERHFVLIETGNEMSSNCQSHYIDKAIYEGLPGSLYGRCGEQSRSTDKYCTLYLVDCDVVKQRVDN